MSTLQRLVAFVLLCVVPLSVAAWPVRQGEYAFWSQMPSPNTVIEGVGGNGKVDRATRAHAAFSMLRILIDIHRDGRGDAPRPEREKVLSAAYTEELEDSYRFGGEANRVTIEQRSLALQADPAFTGEFLQRHFSPEALQELDPLLARMRDDAQRGEGRNRSKLEAVQQASVALPFRALLDRDETSLLFFVLTLGLPVALALVTAREFLPYGLDPVNSTVGRQGFRRFIIDRDAGVVAARGDQFVLATVDGRALTLETRRAPLSFHAGQRLALLRAILPGDSRNPYMLYRDPVARQSIGDAIVLRRLFAPSLWPVVLLGPVVAVWCGLASDFVPIGFTGLVAVLVATSLVAWAIGALLWWQAAARRVARFEADVRERIAPELDRRAALVNG